ncbi:hypothetical protein CKALI_01900 [Corynebacterium kalinowskii]|uniref:Secreted protein n=2 Tax=Corynebacterium kalinowskii TaxID=2675216 RepID=A0A6B8VDY8_9CORY|nr:hypothetical protein CKALI_01900 [Corynebacterium kalinowskii]
MMIFKTARRSALIAVAGVAVAALSACSAGQISQTSDQVAAVDGASANTADKSIAVRDVTVIVDEDQTAALKFTAVNTDTTMKDHTLKSVKVDGKEIQLSEKPKIERNCSVVADSKDNIELLKKNDNVCIIYIDTELPNDGFAVGGQKPVTFEFDSGKIEMNATIAANHNEDVAGNRVEAPKAH